MCYSAKIELGRNAIASRTGTEQQDIVSRSSTDEGRSFLEVSAELSVSLQLLSTLNGVVAIALLQKRK